MYEEIPDLVTLEISGDDVEAVAQSINSYGGPVGAYYKFLRYWCTHFSSKSENLCEELALWA